MLSPDILNAAVVGLVSSGITIGILRTEIKYLRRDIDRLYKHIFPSDDYE